MRTLWAALLVAVAVCGCSGGKSAVHPSTTTKLSTSPASTSTDPPGLTVSPEFVPAAGSPDWCTALGRSTLVTGLQDVFRGLALPDKEAAARQSLRASADALRTLLGIAAPPVKESAAATASALEDLAVAGINDAKAVQVASTALESLGSEVQQLCGYPIG